MEETIHRPLRVIYQLLKAEAKERGCILTNPSDKAVGDGLDEVQAMMDRGEWTQEVQDRVNGVLSAKEAQHGA